MRYDCITVVLRVPARFNDYAFSEAINRLLWQRLGCDPTQTGMIARHRDPAVFGDHQFIADDVTCTIRIEPGKLTERKLWDAVSKYLTQNAGFTAEEAYVRRIDITNDIHRSELPT